MPRSTTLDVFATTAPGLEPLCAAELSALGIRGKVGEGGVTWSGSMESIARANLWLRTASRVLVRVAEFRAKAFFELELNAKKIEWQRWVTPRSTVEFRVTCRKSKLYHSDAVAQRFVESVAKRVPGARVVEAAGSDDEDGKGKSLPAVGMTPSGELVAAPYTEAQLFIVRFLHDVCTVSVDTSGALLHLRGYRQQLAKAPMRETLAAAVLLGSGWTGETPLVDPMCGSGTIPIEAALIARRIAPGRNRSFAFLRWPKADMKMWNTVLDEARANELPKSPVAISGSDRDQGAIVAATANAERAGVAVDVSFSVQPISALDAAPPPGHIASNPPYGVRVGESEGLKNLYAQLGNVARRNRPGWTLALLSADRALEKQVNVPFKECLQTRNGGIPVRLIAGPVPAEVSPRAARRTD